VKQLLRLSIVQQTFYVLLTTLKNSSTISQLSPQLKHSRKSTSRLYTKIKCPDPWNRRANTLSTQSKNATAIDFAVYRGIRPESLSISENLELSTDHIPLIVKLRGAAQKTSRRPCILTQYASLPRFQEAVNRLVNLNMVLRSPDAINDAVELFVRNIGIAAESSTSSSSPSSPHQAP